MTRPRKDQISLSDTPYYHIVSHCVRRTFLCGLDPLTQRDYEHPRQWIVDRIRRKARESYMDPQLNSTIF